MELKEYSERSFAIYGETKEYKTELKNLGGKFNPNLKDGAGWIFSIKYKEDVENWMQNIEPISGERLSVKEYSEKSFKVCGDTKKYKDILKNMGGKWNANLEEGSGWIFSNTHKEDVYEWLSSL